MNNQTLVTKALKSKNKLPLVAKISTKNFKMFAEFVFGSSFILRTKMDQGNEFMVYMFIILSIIWSWSPVSETLLNFNLKESPKWLQFVPLSFLNEFYFAIFFTQRFNLDFPFYFDYNSKRICMKNRSATKLYLTRNNA